MGSSKKHKKDSKKKKHRSRSRSPLDSEERERKRHKKHKDRNKDRSPDVEEVPVDSHLVSKSNGEKSRSRSASADRDRRMREQRHKADRDKSQDLSSIKEASPSGGGGQESLSVAETNRLRAKLGLKPLETTEKTAEDGKIKDDLGEFYHKPAANIAEQQKSEKLRLKLQERKERRNMELKLQTATLGEASADEDDTAAWVKRSREADEQKRAAAKRAALLDEMDAVFGVSALVQEEQHSARAASYSARQLRGLRVAHDVDALGSERDTILTLADKDVLAEDAEDVLVNVNMLDDERYKKNIEERKKARSGYQAYDDEADLEAAAMGYQKPVLSKYDEDIDPTVAAKQKGFVIGDEAALEAKKFRDLMRQEKLQGGPDKRLESLRLPELRLASDYMNEDEINAKFKKPKKRAKGIRKKAKHEPIDVEEYDADTAPLDTDDTDVKPEQMSLTVDEDETEPDTELQVALARARRLRQLEVVASSKLPKVEEILQSVKEEVKMEEDSEESAARGDGGDSGMVLDATAEFCRSLGDIPTYGQAGNRDHHSEIIDFERSELEAEVEAEAAAGAWSRVDVHSEQAAELDAAAAAGGEGALGAEPRLGAGVAGALQLALSKGYLERAGTAPAPKSQHHHLLAARNYSIEDKTYGEEEKHGRRERGGHGGGGGPLSEFREKAGFRPNIKLEYVDDDGRPLCPKEAFRYLSHKFHGKGPGKNKQEKRIKKAVQEGLMKKMSSTDTPLNTLQMLQDKQRETHSAFIVLSGAKRDAHH